MAQIIDYASLTQAISDWTHRADLASNGFTDYFIQTAQNKLANDIFTQNDGNGIAAMEEAMAPTAIAGGTIQVPLDWYAPKALQVADGGGNVFTLIFKSIGWMYDNYPIRQASGLPAYISRDLMAGASFTGSISLTTLTITDPVGLIQIGMPIADGTTQIPFGTIIAGFIDGTSGGAGDYSINTSLGIGAETMTGGGDVFIFGPYPDSSYTVQGSYYSKGLPLNSTNTTNWMVLQCPETLHACCMIEAAKFVKDMAMLQTWTASYQDFLEKLVVGDKSERWAATTMQIEVG